MDCALLVIDMQNGFIHPDGSNAVRGGTLVDAEDVLRETVALVSAAREAGMPIVFTQQVYRPDHLDAPPIMRNLYEEIFPEYLVRGSWDGAIHDRLAPQPGDVVVEKNRYDAFLYTDLELVLRSLGVRSVLIAGVTTATCVETTARSADQRDLAVAVATDCVSDEEVVHQGALDVMARHGMTIVPWRTALDQLMSGGTTRGISSGPAAVRAQSG